MYRKQLLLLVIVLPLLAFMAVPGAGAACGDAPGLFVDWTGCDKTGLDLSGQNLAFMNLTNTDFTSTKLIGTNMQFATINGTIFHNANVKNANMSNISALDNANFINAKIQGLNLAFATVSFADFTDATGVPGLNNTTIYQSTCPFGGDSRATSPFCGWEVPAAISLGNFDAVASLSAWPLVLAGLLLAGTAVIVISRRRREAAVI